MDINERLDAPLFTISFSIREMKEITMLLDERNNALMTKAKMYIALPFSDEKDMEATSREAKTIRSTLEKINYETERVLNIGKENMSTDFGED